MQVSGLRLDTGATPRSGPCGGVAKGCQAAGQTPRRGRTLEFPVATLVAPSTPASRRSRPWRGDPGSRRSRIGATWGDFVDRGLHP